MSNYYLMDKNLSLKAKGLFAQILSLPKDWHFTISNFAEINSDGVDSVRSAIHELEKHGYINRHQLYVSGKYSRAVYDICENPPKSMQ